MSARGIRVAHVTDAMGGGVVTSLGGMARAQAADPAYERVDVAWVRRPITPTRDELAEVCGPQVGLLELSESLGADRFAALVRFLGRSLARRDYDVVHLHCSRTGFLGRVLAAGTGARGVVYTPHGLAFSHGHSPRASEVYRRLEQAGARLRPGFVAVSPSEAATIAGAIPWARTEVVANSVDAAALGALGDRTPWTGERPARVMHVGRLAAPKAPEVYAAALAALAADLTGRGLPAPQATWIGGGEHEFPADLGVEVTGWVEPHEVRERLAEADLLLFTSQGEGLPMVILEAMALGVPVVASRVVGVSDLVDDGRTGLLGGDADELARHAAAVLADPGLQQRLADAGRAEVAAHYDTRDWAQRLRAAYGRLVPGLPAGPAQP
ncbi:MAG: glycosyltransferase family 4 protein [Micrococcales bacterium]|nr:glycosyltransferase family 4 protein [Micrococcales bacterium]